jgi:hypothetical protein
VDELRERPRQSFGRGFTVGRAPELGREGAAGRALGWRLGADGCEVRAGGFVGRAEGALGRAEGAVGRVGAARVPVPERALGVGVTRPEGRCAAPGLGDDEGDGLTMRGSCEPRLVAAGDGSAEDGGGVRAGSLLLGVGGCVVLRCSVGRGAS